MKRNNFNGAESQYQINGEQWTTDQYRLTEETVQLRKTSNFDGMQHQCHRQEPVSNNDDHYERIYNDVSMESQNIHQFIKHQEQYTQRVTNHHGSVSKDASNHVNVRTLDRDIAQTPLEVRLNSDRNSFLQDLDDLPRDFDQINGRDSGIMENYYAKSLEIYSSSDHEGFKTSPGNRQYCSNGHQGIHSTGMVNTILNAQNAQKDNQQHYANRGQESFNSQTFADFESRNYEKTQNTKKPNVDDNYNGSFNCNNNTELQNSSSLTNFIVSSGNEALQGPPRNHPSQKEYIGNRQTSDSFANSVDNNYEKEQTVNNVYVMNHVDGSHNGHHNEKDQYSTIALSTAFGSTYPQCSPKTYSRQPNYEELQQMSSLPEMNRSDSNISEKSDSSLRQREKDNLVKMRSFPNAHREKSSILSEYMDNLLAKYDSQFNESHRNLVNPYSATTPTNSGSDCNTCVGQISRTVETQQFKITNGVLSTLNNETASTGNQLQANIRSFQPELHPLLRAYKPRKGSLGHFLKKMDYFSKPENDGNQQFIPKNKQQSLKKRLQVWRKSNHKNSSFMKLTTNGKRRDDERYESSMPSQLEEEPNEIYGSDSYVDEDPAQLSDVEYGQRVQNQCQWPRCQTTIITCKKGGISRLIEHSVQHSPIFYYKCREDGCDVVVQTKHRIRTHYKHHHGVANVKGYGIKCLPTTDPVFKANFQRCFGDRYFITERVGVFSEMFN